jgi:CubicO group peptidase (beta-lactamase class C family)
MNNNHNKSRKNKKKRIFQIALFSGTVISLFFVPWMLVKAWILPLPDSIQAQTDQAVIHGFEGVIVYIDQGGQEPQIITSGWHERKTKTPARSDALFKIASISKLYDAVAVTKLVSYGRLSLDKTVAEYLPELKGRIENADKITLRLLIQHKSGIPNFTNTPDYWSNPNKTYEENLNLILDKPANFKPDEDYEYCNTNYLLINKIMDNELEYDNFQFIREEILKPLELKHTFGSLNEVDREDVMSGYHQGHPFDLKTNDLGMLATAKDVGTFLRALNDGSLFEPGEKELYDSLYELEHSGWIPGYQSFAKYFEDIDAVIVSFYSTTDRDLMLWNLAEILNTRIKKIVKRKVLK